ncbi:hypothetical protein BJV74DRAFT_46475 [Russula compacta]|nr:hypothetical protein BJV74DRAFT_46475 [Russula compacta]
MLRGRPGLHRSLYTCRPKHPTIITAIVLIVCPTLTVSPFSSRWRLFGCMTHPYDSTPLDDADWEVIADDWWHTPLGLAPCPLSWFDREPRHSRPRRHSEVAANKSHYWHEYLLLIAKNVQGARVCCGSCQEWRYMGCGGMLVCDSMKSVGVQGDLELNLDLVGVKMVLAMVDQLERAVGIITTDHQAAQEIAPLARRVSLLLGDALPVVNPECTWEKYTATVLDGHRIAPHDAEIFRPDLDADPPPADSITSILDLDLDLDPPRKKSPRFSREVIDLTDSEQSVASEAPPATPKPIRSFTTDGDDGTMSGDLRKFHLPRVPSSPSISYSSGSPLTSESSHTRCSSLPPGGELHKEDYDVEVVSESTPSEDAEIPLFLVTSSDRLARQHSRTREIIDRLRSATVPRGRTKASTTRRNSNPGTPTKNRRTGLSNATVKQLFQKGSDGWFRLADDAEYATSRTKDPSQPGHADESRNHTEDSDPSESEDPTFAAPAPTRKSTRDSRKKQMQSRHVRRASGWGEGPSFTAAAAVAHTTATSGNPPRPAHGHQLVQNAQSAAPASVGTFTFPLPPPAYYTFPGPPVPQYAPMVAFGLPPYRGPPRGGYPHPSPPFAGALPHQHQNHQNQHYQHQQPYPHPYVYQPHCAPYANVPVITGSTGIRHAPW